MAVANGIVIKPVEVADLQRLVGVVIQRTVGGVTQRKISADLGVMAGASVGDTVPDDAGGTAWTVISRTEINKMAKYKPIRNSKIEMLAPASGTTPSDRYAARFGFAAVTPSITFDNNTLDPHAEWQYLKPRGNAYNEPYRITDFIDESKPATNGYDSNAVAPFAFKVEGLELTADVVEGNGGVGMMLFVNSGVNSFYTYGLTWNIDTCMTVDELLNNYSGSSYIGFAIQDIDEPTGGFVAVVSRYQLRNISSSVPTVILHSKDYTQGGRLSPAVSLLATGATRSGHTFRVIAFIHSEFPSFTKDGVTYTDQNAEYSILSTSRNFSTNSIEFTRGIDRYDIVAILTGDSIAGLTGELISQNHNVTLTLTSQSTVIYNNRPCYKYRVGGQVKANFQTPVGHWGSTGARIHVRITGNGIPSYINDAGNCEYEVNVELPYNNHSYPNVLLVDFTNQQELYIYVDESVAKSTNPFIYITATATPNLIIVQETVYLDNSITAESPRIQ